MIIQTQIQLSAMQLSAHTIHLYQVISSNLIAAYAYCIASPLMVALIISMAVLSIGILASNRKHMSTKEAVTTPKNKHENRKEEPKKTHQQEIEELQADITQLKGNNTSLKTANERLTRELSTTKTQLTSTNQTTAGAIDELAQIIVELKEVNIDITSAKEEASGKITQLQSEFATTQHENAVLSNLNRLPMDYLQFTETLKPYRVQFWNKHMEALEDNPSTTFTTESYICINPHSTKIFTPFNYAILIDRGTNETKRDGEPRFEYKIKEAGYSGALMDFHQTSIFQKYQGQLINNDSVTHFIKIMDEYCLLKLNDPNALSVPLPTTVKGRMDSLTSLPDILKNGDQRGVNEIERKTFEVCMEHIEATVKYATTLLNTYTVHYIEQTNIAKLIKLINIFNGETKDQPKDALLSIIESEELRLKTDEGESISMRGICLKIAALLQSCVQECTPNTPHLALKVKLFGLQSEELTKHRAYTTIDGEKNISIKGLIVSAAKLNPLRNLVAKTGRHPLVILLCNIGEDFTQKIPNLQIQPHLKLTAEALEGLSPQNSSAQNVARLSMSFNRTSKGGAAAAPTSPQ